MSFPKEPRENLEWRHRILSRSLEDPVYRAKVKRLFHEDVLFAFNAFYYTLDVRKRPFHNQPFCTWEYQDDVILDLQMAVKEGGDRAIVKSRDMGVSWMVLLVFHHEWLDPRGGGDFLVGSRIEDYVDRKGDMRTLFEKLRYAHYKLPKWIQPQGFQRRVHDTYAKLINPESGASITGESNNPNFSTGGRYAGILYDEFAKWKESDTAAWTAGGDASPCRVGASTYFGEGGKFFQITTDGRTKVLSLHWGLHPEKAKGVSCVWPAPNEDDKGMLGVHWEPEEKLTSPWYEKEAERRTQEEIAQELDMEPAGSGTPVFGGKCLQAIKMYRKFPDEPVAWGSFVDSYLEMKIEEREPRDPEGYLCIYKRFAPGGQWALGVDVVEGVEGGDYAVVTVLNRRTKDVDAVYWSRVDEITLGWVVKCVSDYYSPEKDSSEAPYVGIETTGPGLATFDKCVDIGLTNLFMAMRFDVSLQAPTYKKGWRTDLHSRNELIGGIKSYLLYRAGKINSRRLLGELVTFVRGATGKAAAKSSCKDDMVMSFGIVIQVDQLAPSGWGVEKPLKELEHSDVSPVQRELLRIEGEATTIEQRCLECVVAKKALEERVESGEMWEDW